MLYIYIYIYLSIQDPTAATIYKLTFVKSQSSFCDLVTTRALGRISGRARPGVILHVGGPTGWPHLQ